MKLARFSNHKEASYGVFRDDHIICLPTLAKESGESLPSSLEALISKGTGRTDVEKMIRNAPKTALQKATLSLNQVKLLAPISRPPKIVCLGLNYLDHIAEQGVHAPSEPVFFMKPHTTIIGPDEDIVKPTLVEKLDYEAELAIIMGEKARHASVRKVRSTIFGYTIMNDVSARDIQFRDKQWTRGKSFDTFAPIGPNITVAKQITNPTNLHIRTWVNKELRQNSTTRNMLFNVFQIVHHLSLVMTLEPCDIISTGTPAGVGFAIKPKPKFLKQGDIVEIEIEGIGILRNRIRKERLMTKGS